MNRRNFIIGFLTCLLTAALLCGCQNLPQKVQPDDEFEALSEEEFIEEEFSEEEEEFAIINNSDEEEQEEFEEFEDGEEGEEFDVLEEEDDGLIINPDHDAAISSPIHIASISYTAPVRLAGSSTESTVIQRPAETADSGQIIENNTAIVYPEQQPVLQKSVPVSQLGPLTSMPPMKLNSGSAIYFGAGETSAVISGYVQAGSYVSYNLYAFADQNFLVLLTSDSGTSVLGITDAYGNSFLDPNQHQTSYQMYLPRTTTYYVNIYSTGATENFTIQVFIPARVTFQASRTSQSYTGTLNPYGIVSYTCYIYAGREIRIDDYSGITPTSFLRVSGLQTGTVYQDYTSYSPSWYAVAPVTQDYLIEVITLDQPSYYKLTVDVR